MYTHLWYYRTITKYRSQHNILLSTQNVVLRLIISIYKESFKKIKMIYNSYFKKIEEYFIFCRKLNPLWNGDI